MANFEQFKDPFRAKAAYDDMIGKGFDEGTALKALEADKGPVNPTPLTDKFRTTSSNNIVSGSENVRKDVNAVRTDTTGLMADIGNLDVQTTIDDIRTAIGYQDPNAELTADQLANIEKEGVRAGAQYDQSIQEAQEAQRRGQPVADISGGERGGFMNTQIAGKAAVLPTEGGDFRGAGGKLKEIEMDYDRNIQNLHAQKNRAIELAKEKAEEAIRTGKREDNQAAQELFKLAQDANQKAIDLADSKVELIASYRKEEQVRTDYGIDKVTALSETNSPLTDEMIEGIDSIYGDGYAQKLYDTNQKMSDMENLEDEVGLLKDVYSLLDKVPIGEKIKLGDNTYEGLKRDEKSHVYKEISPSGEVMIVEFDPISKEIMSYSSGVMTKVKNSTDYGTGITQDIQSLINTRGEDGYINTEEYAKLYEKYSLSGAKVLKDFVNRVPANVYLNPSDPTAKKYFQSKTQAISDSGGGGEDYNAMFPEG